MDSKTDRWVVTWWYKNGVVHRDDDLPACVYSDGTAVWYKDGTVHRDNDLPAIIKPTVTKSDGTEEKGSRYWFKYGTCHRLGGQPAVISSDGRTRYMKQGKECYPSQAVGQDTPEFWKPILDELDRKKLELAERKIRRMNVSL